MPYNYSNFSAPQFDLVGNVDAGQQGAYVIPPLCTPDKAAGIASASGRVWYVRFRPGRVMRVSSIAYAVTTASQNDDNVDVGIFDGVSGTKLASSGAVAGKLNATGATSVNLTAGVWLNPGQTYYVGLACGTLGGTAATLASIAAPLSNTAVTALFGAAYPAAELSFVTSGVTALPASLSAYGAVAVAPLLALREI